MDLGDILGIFGMPPMPGVLSIPAIHEKLDEKGNDTGGALTQSTNKFINELIWYAEALKDKRQQGLPA